MAKDFISDKEMDQLTSQGKTNVYRPPMVKSEDFISDQEMSKLEDTGKAKAIVPQSGGPGIAQTVLEHFGNTALLGYLPHAEALVEKLLPNPSSEVDQQLREKGFTLTPPRSYVEARDENIKRLAQEKKSHPNAALAGDVLGIAGNAILTGGVAKALGTGASAASTLWGRLEQGAKTGAAIGALANPGDAEGEVSPLQVPDRIHNAGVGGVLGAGATALAEGLGAAKNKFTDYFKGKADEKAIGAVGATKADLKRLGTKSSNELGEYALNEELVTPLGTPTGIAKKVAERKEAVGDKIGKLISDADQAGASKIDGTKIGLSLLDDPEILAAKRTPGSSGMYSAAAKEAETLASAGEMSLQEAHALRRNIDKNIQFNKRRADLKPGEQEVLYKIRDTINKEINDAVNKMGVGDTVDALKKANQEYSKLSTLQNMAENRSAMDASNRTFSLTDTIATGAGLAAGSTPAQKVATAAAAGALNKLGRTFGKSLQATGFDASSRLLAQSPDVAKLASSNPGVFQSLVSSLHGGVGGSAPFEKSQESNILDNPQIMGIFRQNPALIDTIRDEKLKLQVRQRINREPSNDTAMSRRLKKQ